MFGTLLIFEQELNLKRIGISMSNITVITLNNSAKLARGCCVHVFLLTFMRVVIHGLSDWCIPTGFMAIVVLRMLIKVEVKSSTFQWVEADSKM